MDNHVKIPFTRNRVKKGWYHEFIRFVPKPPLIWTSTKEPNQLFFPSFLFGFYLLFCENLPAKGGQNTDLLLCLCLYLRQSHESFTNSDSALQISQSTTRRKQPKADRHRGRGRERDALSHLKLLKKESAHKSEHCCLPGSREKNYGRHFRDCFPDLQLPPTAPSPLYALPDCLSSKHSMAPPGRTLSLYLGGQRLPRPNIFLSTSTYGSFA